MFTADGILGRSFQVVSAGLDGLAMRQQVHAENLANIDTEGYTARTVDFESTLQAAIAGDDPGIRSTSSMPGNTSASGELRLAGEMASTFTVAARGGGESNVDRVTEVTRMMNDNIRFRVLTQQATNSISALRSVISEMRS